MCLQLHVVKHAHSFDQSLLPSRFHARIRELPSSFHARIQEITIAYFCTPSSCIAQAQGKKGEISVQC
jgi:hypothetical protein